MPTTKNQVNQSSTKGTEVGRKFKDIFFFSPMPSCTFLGVSSYNLPGRQILPIVKAETQIWNIRSVCMWFAFRRSFGRQHHNKSYCSHAYVCVCVYVDMRDISEIKTDITKYHFDSCVSETDNFFFITLVSSITSFDHLWGLYLHMFCILPLTNLRFSFVQKPKKKISGDIFFYFWSYVSIDIDEYRMRSGIFSKWVFGLMMIDMHVKAFLLTICILARYLCILFSSHLKCINDVMYMNRNDDDDKRR